MGSSSKAACLAIISLVLTMAVNDVQVTTAVTCNPLQLSACATAITSSSKPSGVCCTSIRQQRPCLCQYMKNPNLQKFINSPGARKVARYCRTPFPRC